MCLSKPPPIMRVKLYMPSFTSPYNTILFSSLWFVERPLKTSSTTQPSQFSPLKITKTFLCILDKAFWTPSNRRMSTPLMSFSIIKSVSAQFSRKIQIGMPSCTWCSSVTRKSFTSYIRTHPNVVCTAIVFSRTTVPSAYGRLPPLLLMSVT